MINKDEVYEQAYLVYTKKHQLQMKYAREAIDNAILQTAKEGRFSLLLHLLHCQVLKILNFQLMNMLMLVMTSPQVVITTTYSLYLGRNRGKIYYDD